MEQEWSKNGASNSLDLQQALNVYHVLKSVGVATPVFSIESAGRSSG